MAIREILDLIDDKRWDDNEFKSLLKELDEEISSLKPPNKSIVVDKTENTTVRMEIQNGKLRIVNALEGPQTSISLIRKYVTRKTIETLLSSKVIPSAFSLLSWLVYTLITYCYNMDVPSEGTPCCLSNVLAIASGLIPPG